MKSAGIKFSQAGTAMRFMMMNLTGDVTFVGAIQSFITGVKQKEKIGVEYFDTEILEMRRTEMYMEGYKAGC